LQPFPVIQVLDLDDLQKVVHQLGGEVEYVNVVGNLQRLLTNDFATSYESVVGLLKLQRKYPCRDNLRDELVKEVENLERIAQGLAQHFFEAAQAVEVLNHFIKEKLLANFNFQTCTNKLELINGHL
jgi:hypothetical protein